MFNKLKQFQDLKSRAKTIQSTLAKESAEGSAGWGKVRVKIDGNQNITDIRIDPDAMADREKLQQMVKEAANDAIKKIQGVMSKKLRDIGGLDLAQEFGDAIKK